MKIRPVARAVLSILLILASTSTLSRAAQPSAEALFKSGLYEEEVRGDLPKAIAIYQDLLKRFPGSREAAAKAQLHIGLCYEKLGTTEAEKAFQKVVDNYPEQSDAVREAKGKLSFLSRSRAAAKTGVSEFSTRRVWSGPDVEIEGAVSPDGRFLSFVDMETGDLSVRDLSAGTNRRLTRIDEKQPWSEFAMFSKWSPDGRRIAYQWYCKDDILELRVLDLSDSSVRTILRDKSAKDWAQAFDWSPDGRHILAAIFLEATPTQGRETRVGLISVEDGSFKRIEGHYGTLLTSSSLPQGFSFSPDGRFIVYDASRSDEESGDREIFLIELANGKESVLAEHPGFEEVVAWTPDGRGLLFTSDRTGTLDLYLLALSNGKPQEAPRLIKSGIGTITPLGFNPRGDFYYGQGGSENDIYSVEVDPGTGKLLGPAKKLALPLQGRNMGPSYSPDGKHLAYLSATGGRGQVIGIYSQETGRVRELNPRLSGNLFPQWIPPDGRALSVLVGDKEGRRVIYKVDLQTGEAAPIGPVAESGFSFRNLPVWAADGKRFYYTGGLGSDEKRYIYTFDLETGKSERLPGTPDDACFITLSPDGKWLAFINEHGKKILRVIPTTGGQPREVHSYEHSDHVISPAWSADGRSIYLPKLSDPKRSFWDLYRISLDGRDVEKTEVGLSWIRSLSASPDGRSLAFQSSGKGLRPQEVWVMENFLPAAPAVTEKTLNTRMVWSGSEAKTVSHVSQDGTSLTFIDEETGNLCVKDIASGRESVVVRRDASAEPYEFPITARWSPDGKRLAYSWFNKDNSIELRMVDTDGSNLRTLYAQKNEVMVPMAWSPDGRTIAVVFIRDF
jgi:Tol biopolymer transport system component